MANSKLAELTAYSKLPIELQYFAIHSVTLVNTPVLFLKNSKAGCTSMTHMLYESQTGQRYNGVIHEEHSTLIQGFEGWKTVEHRRMSNNVFTFSIIRNPTDRIRSSFIDFFVDRKNPGVQKLARFVDDFELANRSRAFQLSAFLAAIEEWAAMSESTMDRHWRPQCKNLAIDYIQYDFLGRLEELLLWYKQLSDRLRTYGVALPDRPVKRKSSDADIVLEKDHEQAIARIYTRDFDLYEQNRMEC